MAAKRLLRFLWDVSSQTWMRRLCKFSFYLAGNAIVFLFLIHIKAGVFRIPLIQFAVTVTPTAPIGHGVWRRQNTIQTRKNPWKRRRPCGDGNICVDPRWPQAWIRMSHIVDFKRWWPTNPHLTGPLSLLWQYGLCASKVPRWLRRSSVFLFQGWNRIINASNVWPYVSTGRQRLFRRVCKELRADLSTVTLFTVIRESGL